MYRNTTVVIKKCVQFVGLYCSNYVRMHGMETVKFVNIYQDDLIRVFSSYSLASL